MSAFLVSYNHINTLCNYIYLHNLDNDYASIEQVQALGNMLWRENARLKLGELLTHRNNLLEKAVEAGFDYEPEEISKSKVRYVLKRAS